MTKLTQENNEQLEIEKIEEQNPVSVLLAELDYRLRTGSSNVAEQEHISKLKQATENAAADIVNWSEAVGHLASLASTHGEADTQTMKALGISADMLGKLSLITSMLRLTGESARLLSD